MREMKFLRQEKGTFLFIAVRSIDEIVHSVSEESNSAVIKDNFQHSAVCDRTNLSLLR